MMKKNLIASVVIVVVFAGGFIAYSVGPNPGNELLPPPEQSGVTQLQQPVKTQVQTKPDEQNEEPLLRIFYGTIAPLAEANVQSRQGGRITMLKGKEGDSVRKGDVIVRFDDSDIRLQLQQAVSSRNSAVQQVNQAESNFNTIQSDVARYQNLFKEGFVAKQQVDTLENQLESARSALHSAQESVTQADVHIALLNNTLRDLQVTAPISGIIDMCQYNEQEIYRSGDVLCHVISIDQVYVEVSIPETYIGRIHEQMSVDVGVDAFEGQHFTGTIETILPSGNASNRTFTVNVLVENSELRLKPGMFAHISIMLDI